MSGPSPISFGDLAHTIGMLERLAEWFERFGNYTRANDCRRLADGLREYADDIAPRPKPRKSKPSSQRPWIGGYGR